MPSTRQRLSLGLGLTLVASGLLIAPTPAATANPAGTGLVISEVYGGGGNSGATLRRDFIELYNPTSAAIPVTGMSVQYRATGSTGAATGVTALTGSVPAKGHYLVAQAAGNGGTVDLPAPDVTGDIAMQGQNFTVFLASGTAALDPGVGAVKAVAGIADLVGVNSNVFETTKAAVIANTTSSSRATTGADTDVNLADFKTGVPTPTSSGGGADPDPDPDPQPGVAKTIPEIQGTAAASTLVGQTVTTKGVVTAAYPSGGLFGFYLQTAGTGGPTDPSTRTTSDAIFVRQTQAAGAVTVKPGDSVQVAGKVTEFAGQTQVEVSSAASITKVTPVLAAVTPTTTAAWPATDALKERLEGMLLTPSGPFTVSNNYSTNRFGELGLAQGTTPLRTPTDVAAPRSGAYTAAVSDNAARAITLDDGASTDFTATGNTKLTPPWISNTAPIRIGATGTFSQPVILTQGGTPSAPTYRFLPRDVVAGPANTGAPVTFANTRETAPTASALAATGTPAVKVASFNVLNYFTTLGDANDDNVGEGGCTAFTDRDGDGNNVSSGCDQRGAWDPQDLARQQAKIVSAINALDADVVGLMEIENSAALGETPDEATTALVAALNAKAGAGTWAANPSSADLPPASGSDVISNAIIYKPATVSRTGAARALGDQSDTGEAFSNAREPVAQAFTPVAGGAPFMVVVNHFKSKGSGTGADADQNDGQGASNASRVKQATALAAWVPTIQNGVAEVLLLGDFNAYTEEDPMKVLYDAGYADAVKTAGRGESSYSFDGQSGSLDHILVNAAAKASFTGADIWNINAVEPLPLEYSRFNYHGTDFHTDGPWRSSDHDPVVVGLKRGTGPDPEPTTREIQILATNDFHGRILNNSSGTEAGAAVLSGAVKELRAENPNTVFAAAGDLIGASTFESFIQRDEPTIDALNEAGLDVSAAGNHEFDKGYDDLAGRVQDRADWEYIAANVRKKMDDSHALAPTYVEELDGVTVGFVGAVTEHLPELVSPDGIADIEVTDIVTEVNASAADLEADGADVIVLLVHEGAAGTDCATMDDDPTSDFGSIITGVDEDVDAIVSGHTHLAYNCSFPVEEWKDRPVKERPVVSAGQYGSNLNQLVLTVDPTTGEVQTQTQEILKLKADPATPNYPSDPAVEPIVADAVKVAAVEGAKPLGEIAGSFTRAYLANGTTENRGGESTLGNLVAEIQQSATESETTGAAQIAFMNPGGLRADILATIGAGETSSTLTFRQAADVQPFANTLINMDLTGTQIESVLEEQWQAPGASRPFLKLGSSEGFTYTYVPPAAGAPAGTKGEVTAMYLDGEPLDPAASYSVTVNSFLAAGGDGFATLAQGTGKQDTGQSDLEATVSFMAENATAAEPLEVDYSQRAVGTTFPADAPEAYAPGSDVTLDLTSLSMTGPTDITDDEVTVALGDEELGTFGVTTTVQAALPGFDEAGTASVDVTLPAGTASGATALVVRGVDTGTEVEVPITVEGGDAELVDSTTTAKVSPSKIKTGGSATVRVRVRADGVTPTGTVRVSAGGRTETARLDAAGRASVRIGAFALNGRKLVRVRYVGSDTVAPSSTRTSLRVFRDRARMSVQRTPRPVVAGQDRVLMTVDVRGLGRPASGVVRFRDRGVTYDRRLVDGSARLRLPVHVQGGQKVVRVIYRGSRSLQPEVKIIRFSVRGR